MGTDSSGFAPIQPGNYKTSVAGPWDSDGTHGGNVNAGQFTSFASNSGFVGLTAAQANGTWTLRFRDGDSDGETGAVTDASLTITPVPEPSQYALVAGLALLSFAGYRRLARAKN